MAVKPNFENIVTGILVTGLVIAVIAMIIAFPALWLWNACMPHIFGLPVVDYWTMVPFVLLWGILTRPITYSYQKKEG